MSIVVINAITVPEGAGAELEARFAARKGAVDQAPGFEGFQLLRPVAGESRYFVMTTWATRADFESWRDNGAKAAHAPTASAHAPTASGHGGSAPKPVATGAELLEFEIVDLGA